MLTTDIADAFPSTSTRLIRQSLQRSLRRRKFPDGLSQPVASLVTYRGSLPQGAPSSVAVLDVVLCEFDEDLARICAERGARYSRYVDDLTVSCATDVSWALAEIRSRLKALSYRLNDSKTEIFRPGHRATITGLILGKRPLVAEEYCKDVKRAVARVVSGEWTLSSEEHESLIGRINWVYSIHPILGRRLRLRMGLATPPLARSC